MKRILMIVIVCATLAVALTTHAEEVDLAAMTDADIVSLLARVQAEVVDRHIEKTASLQAGTYTGGREIPAGAYVLAATGKEGDAGIVSLRSANDDADSFPSKLYKFERGDGGFTVFITVEDGDALVLPFPFSLTISGGLRFK